MRCLIGVLLLSFCFSSITEAGIFKKRNKHLRRSCKSCKKVEKTSCNEASCEKKEALEVPPTPTDTTFEDYERYWTLRLYR